MASIDSGIVKDIKNPTKAKITMNTYIPTKDELQKAIEEAVETAVTSKLPTIINQATRKPYYTIGEACEILSVTRRHLQHLRDTNQISFVQHGKKIYFKASDLDEFFGKNYVNNVSCVPNNQNTSEGEGK